MCTAAIEVLEHLTPAIGALLTANVESENLAVSFLVDAHGEANQLTAYRAALELRVQTVQVNDGIPFLYGTCLPVLEIFKHGSGDITDGGGGVVAAKHALDESGDIAGSHAAFIHLDDGFLQPSVTPLVGLEYLRLELSVTVMWNFELLDIAVFGVQAAVFVAAVTLPF